MKFSSYPVITTPAAADTALLHQDSSNAEKQITIADLAAYFNQTPAVQPRCVIQLSGDQAIANATDTEPVWGNVIQNDEGIWNVANPSRLSVPASATSVRITVGIRWTANTTGYRKVTILDNSANIWGASDHATGATGDTAFTTCIIPTAGISYFYVKVFQNSTISLNIRAVHGCFMQMEIID